MVSRSGHTRSEAFAASRLVSPSVRLNARWSTVLWGTVLLSLSLAGCGEQEAAPAVTPPPPAVRVSKPLLREIVEWQEYTGRIAAMHSVQIRSRVSGYLDSINFEEGQDVRRDDLLFVIDPRPFQADVRRAQAALAEARARVEEAEAQLAQARASRGTAQAQLTFASSEFDRVEALRKQSATTQSDVEQARNEFQKAQAGLEAADAGIALASAAIATAGAAVESASAAEAEAQLNLGYTSIKSPLSGRISRRYVSEGNLISGGSEQSTLLTNIVSLDPIYFVFDASEQEVLRFRRLVLEGSRRDAREVRYPVHLALADETGFPHQGYIDFVDNQLDPATATLTARAEFANSDGILTPGMFAKIQIASTLPYEAILLPDSAVGADQAESFVYVVDQDETVRMQVVETGPLALGLRVIRSGITANDRVVIAGLQRVRAGAVVQATPDTITADEDQQIQYESAPVEKDAK